MTWDQWHDVVQTVLAFVVGPSVAYGVWIVRGIRAELHTMDRRLLRVEQWRTDFERASEKLHEENLKRLDRIQVSLDQLRGELNAAILHVARHSAREPSP